MSNFKVGDKVKCIYAGGPDNNVTIGKIYKVIREKDCDGLIKVDGDDKSCPMGVWPRRFVMVKEIGVYHAHKHTDTDTAILFKKDEWSDAQQCRDKYLLDTIKKHDAYPCTIHTFTAGVEVSKEMLYKPKLTLKDLKYGTKFNFTHTDGQRNCVRGYLNSLNDFKAKGDGWWITESNVFVLESDTTRDLEVEVIE